MPDRDRDRDQAGRAINARPRDGLGRPLPYGSPDVERAPAGVVRAPAESLALAQRLLDTDKPFHAHEVLEDAWKSAAAGEGALWKALAQLAVAATHAARGNATGAARLRARGGAALRAHEFVLTDSTDAVDLPGLIRWAESGGVGGLRLLRPPSA